MKCIHCGSDSRLKDRADGRCPQCRHAFAFEPTKDPHKVTDTQFHAAVQRVSGDGAVHFTARQLWYEFNRKWMKPSFWRSPFGWFPPLGGAGGAALGALGVVKIALFPLVAIGVAAGAAVGAFFSLASEGGGGPPARPPRIPFEIFRKNYLERWMEVHGSATGLLSPPAPGGAARAVPADVAAFSFDRAVVTQDAETAAMLVANRFHFEHNCAVLSLDGYPFGIAETVKEMLRRNPRLTVFALHDASAEGAALPFTLREDAWFPAPSTLIVDVGLRTPRSAAGPLPVLPGRPVKLPEAVRTALAPADPAWYEAGNRAELAALRPAAIMRELQRAFAATGLPGDPAYDDALSRAAAADGIIWMGVLVASRPGAGDGGGGAGTATTDGFG